MATDREGVAMSEAIRLRRELYAEIRRLRSDMNDRVGYVDERLTMHIYDRTNSLPTGLYAGHQNNGDTTRNPFRRTDFLIKVLYVEIALIWILAFVLYCLLLTW